MASLDEKGHEILDQTPVAIPFDVTRPEPIHLRMRRIAESFYQERINAGDDVETLDEANDFDVPDDPTCAEPYPEPDYLPSVSEASRLDGPVTQEELAAAREMILERRKQAVSQSKNAGGEGAVSSAPTAPAEPAS
ncbi:hypothetical protein [uncultured Desulfovibrio sp.]|uniref:hypothetical protein n=1 Tax=uncultured Desulfovibrio sp. TaxID=167968 RepID=UPI0028042B94|nr:hypothetical protein [uncultured Desulfovibrio sp.]